MMSKFFRAVESDTQVLVFNIKTREFLGMAKVATRRGDEYVSVRFEDGTIMDLVAQIKSFQAAGPRFSYYRYSPVTGVYLGRGPEDDNDSEILGSTIIVDAFNFRWGLVPDHFKKYPGYATSKIEIKQGGEQQ